MKNIPQAIQKTHFRYLKESAVCNPLRFIHQFCVLETELEFFRQDVSFLIQAAGTKITDHHGAFYKHADEYVYNHRKIIEMLECLWIFYRFDIPELNLSDSHPLYQKGSEEKKYIDMEERLDGPAKHFRKLENKEINNVCLFLQEFFLFNDLDEWRETLDQLLSYAHMNESITHESSYFSRELIPITSYLEKMVEAFFLIAELLPGDNLTALPKSSNQQFISTKHPYMSCLATTGTPPLLVLEDATYVDSLIIYLSTFWSHLEEEDLNQSHGPKQNS